MKTLLRVLLVFALAMFVAGFSLMLWEFAHDISALPSPVPFISFGGAIPIIVIALKPRWQLGADALWELRRAETELAPYASISSVRVIKSRKNGSKVFEIVTFEKTYKLDVLQGEAFENDLTIHIGAPKITVS